MKEFQLKIAEVTGKLARQVFSNARLTRALDDMQMKVAIARPEQSDKRDIVTVGGCLSYRNEEFWVVALRNNIRQSKDRLYSVERPNGISDEHMHQLLDIAIEHLERQILGPNVKTEEKDMFDFE